MRAVRLYGLLSSLVFREMNLIAIVSRQGNTGRKTYYAVTKVLRQVARKGGDVPDCYQAGVHLDWR